MPPGQEIGAIPLVMIATSTLDLLDPATNRPGRALVDQVTCVANRPFTLQIQLPYSLRSARYHDNYFVLGHHLVSTCRPGFRVGGERQVRDHAG